MWRTAVRDLQWRARRVVIAATGTALVFAMALVIVGLSSSFKAEAGRTIKAFGADAWVVRAGIYGPFTTVAGLPTSDAGVVRGLPGVTHADPVLILHGTVRLPAITDVNIVGFAKGGLGQPKVHRGREPRAAHELVADTTLPGVHLGKTYDLSGTTFTVVGITAGMTVNGGQPVIYAHIHDVEDLVFPGAQLASAILTTGVPREVPQGLAVRTNGQSKTDTLRPLRNALQSLGLTAALMLIVAGLVIGSVIYLSALERGRDFAVFKATGWGSRTLLVELAGQAVVLSFASAVLGILAAKLLEPVFPLQFDIPVGDILLLPVVAVVVGLLASVAGIRKVLAVDPALAFGGP